MTDTKTKTEAVKEAMEKINPKTSEKIKRKQFREIAKKYKMTTQCLHYAYENMLNFKTVDKRMAYQTRHSNRLSKEQKDALKNYVVYDHIPHKERTTKEQKLLVHEYLFGTKDKISVFRKNNNVSALDWFNIMKQLKISGKIGNSKIFDYTKYAKPELNAALVYAKYITKYGKGNLSKPLSQSVLNKSKYLRNLKNNDEAIIRRLVKVLYFYTLK